MKNLTSIGRILFALPFGILGLNHFFMKDYYLMQVTSFIPGMGFSILLVGLALIAVSVSLIANKFVQASCWVLAGLLSLFIITIHIPHIFSDLHDSTISMIELMKDTALLGGALMIAGMKGNEKKGI